MTQIIHRFRPLSLRPHWKQFAIDEMLWLVLCVTAFTVYACGDFILVETFLYLGAALTVYLLYRLVYLARMEYIVTEDQIIFLHGVVSHSTDYMELYRVVDYRQQRTLMQQLTGLKTVVIYSGDRNTPVIHIIGMKNKKNVIAEIRERVEYNKTKKHIYEITNRM